MQQLLLMLVMVYWSAQAMFECRLACDVDVPQILSLMNDEAVRETEKLVVLPKKFRKSFVREAVDRDRLFVATKNNQIVAYKKLFLLTDEIEKYNILTNELRCEGKESQCVFSGLVNQDGLVVRSEAADRQPKFYPYDACIYDGLDFTKNAFRGMGVNRTLTEMALNAITPQVHDMLSNRRASSVSLLYGLTNSNAGEQPGKLPDRTMSIAKSFQKFVHQLDGPSEPIILEHYRYKAFMPTFDPDDLDCIPLPDEKAIPGLGCVLTYRPRERYV